MDNELDMDLVAKINGYGLWIEIWIFILDNGFRNWF